MEYLKESPCIAKLLAYTENTPSIVMKYYKYGNLKSWLKKVMLTKRALINIFCHVCFGVQAMHNVDIVHLDLKMVNL